MFTPIICTGKDSVERTYFVEVEEYTDRSERLDDPHFRSTHWDITVHLRNPPRPSGGPAVRLRGVAGGRDPRDVGET